MTSDDENSANIIDHEILCSGKIVDLCYPLPRDYNFLVNLRNNPLVRKEFRDSRPITREQGHIWLNSHARRMDDLLLLIRHRELMLNIGSIGWSQYDPITRSAEFGRLALDPVSLRRMVLLNKKMSILLHGLALDAALAICQYAFSRLNLEVIRTCYKQHNTHSARINSMVGMVVSHISNEPKDNDYVYLTLTRQQWIMLGHNK